MYTRVLIGALIAAVPIAACSRSNIAPSTAAPSEVRCQLSMTTTPAGFGASGGAGAISFSTPRECVWSARAEVSWIAGVVPASGQGSARLEFRVMANASQASRRGTILINDRRIDVDQQGARPVCEVSISPSSRNVDVDGGSGRIAIEAPSGCAWQASSDAGWLEITSNRGSGDGSVDYDVAANTGGERSGRVTIGGRRFTVTQAARPARPSCNYTVTPNAFTIDHAAGTRSVSVSSAAECGWRAERVSSWMTIASGATGSGSGTVRFDVAANPGAERTGTLEIAGTTVRVRQSGVPPCTYALSSTSVSFDDDRNDGTTTIATGEGCAWTAASNDSWIELRSSSSGTGPATVRFRARENRDSERTGTLAIAGITFTIVQEGGRGHGKGNGNDDD